MMYSMLRAGKMKEDGRRTITYFKYNITFIISTYLKHKKQQGMKEWIEQMIRRQKNTVPFTLMSGLWALSTKGQRQIEKNDKKSIESRKKKSLNITIGEES